MKFLRELGRNRQDKIGEIRLFGKPLSLGKIGQNRLKPIFPASHVHSTCAFSKSYQVSVLYSHQTFDTAKTDWAN